ncbi:17879_t:CDS:2, partial [Funneliformis geosporum]
KDIEVPELGPYSKCNNEILMLPIKAFTVLSCGHVFHREYDDGEEVESIPLRSTQPEQSTSVSSSSK